MCEILDLPGNHSISWPHRVLEGSGSHLKAGSGRHSRWVHVAQSRVVSIEQVMIYVIHFHTVTYNQPIPCFRWGTPWKSHIIARVIVVHQSNSLANQLLEAQDHNSQSYEMIAYPLVAHLTTAAPKKHPKVVILEMIEKKEHRRTIILENSFVACGITWGCSTYSI